MLRIIHEYDDPDLMERVWSFRHVRFVEQLGWEELCRPDRRERDRFDTEWAVHAVLLHHDQIIGYSRLIPTTVPHLAAEARPPQVTLPNGPHVFEWTRCATALDPPLVDGVAASDILMTGVLECLLHLDAQEILFLTYPKLVKMMGRRGYPVNLLATLAAESGKPIQIASAKLSADLLRLHRRTYGISNSLLSWSNVERSVPERSPTAA